MTAAAADELHTIIDLIRYGTSRFNAAGLTFGHSYDNALDEATQMVLHTLHLPHDLGPAYGQARLLRWEKEQVLGCSSAASPSAFRRRTSPARPGLPA